MVGQTYLAAELARISYLEAHPEGLNGCLAVAFVLRNRVRAGWWNSDWSTVLSNHQTWSASLEPLPSTIPDPRNYTFNRLLQEIDGIFQGTVDDTITVPADSISNYMRVGQARTGDISVAATAPVALYFGYMNKDLSKFFTENIIGNSAHRLVASVGALSFFS